LPILKLDIRKIKELLDGVGIVIELELIENLLQAVVLLINLNLEDVHLIIFDEFLNMMGILDLQII
jgi:hypothetical protein